MQQRGVGGKIRSYSIHACAETMKSDRIIGHPQAEEMEIPLLGIIELIQIGNPMLGRPVRPNTGRLDLDRGGGPLEVVSVPCGTTPSSQDVSCLLYTSPSPRDGL